MRARSCVVVVVVGAAVVLVVVAAVAGYLALVDSGRSARGLAAVTAAWTGPERMTEVYEYDGRSGRIDNSGPPFSIRIYRSGKPLDGLKDDLLALLRRDGYAALAQPVVKTPATRYTHPGSATNHWSSYWLITGQDGRNDAATIEITDRTCFNTANTLDSGEKPVPSGSVVAVVTFTAHG